MGNESKVFRGLKLDFESDSQRNAVQTMVFDCKKCWSKFDNKPEIPLNMLTAKNYFGGTSSLNKSY